MSAEAGAVPGNSTALYDRLVRGQLIGREHQLSELQQHWQRAVSGEGHVVLVGGPPGIGKTRLAREQAAQARAAGAHVLVGECYAEQGPPFALLADALRSLLGSPIDRLKEWQAWRDRLGPGGGDLLELIPEYRPLFPGLAASPPLAPAAQQRRLFEAYALLLEGLSLERPLLLLLDDVHWADEASLDLWLYLARRLARCPVLFLATGRLDEAGPALTHMLTALNRARLIYEMYLAPLDPPQVAELVRYLFDLPVDPAPDFNAELFERTEGNPFFVEELLMAVGEASSPANWSRATLEAVAAPRSIRETIEWQMSRLSPSAQIVATWAAVIGRRFDFDFLRAVAGFDEDQLLLELRALRQAQILVEQPALSGVTYAFRHPLMHEVIYQRSLAAERRKLHALVAAALERTYGFDQAQLEAIRARLPHHWWTPHKNVGVPLEVDQLARHWLLGGVWDKAFRFALLAAERSVALYASRNALEWSSQALALAADGRARPEEVALCEAYLARCNCQWMVGSYIAAMADGEAALRLAREPEHWQHEAVALHWLGHVALDQGAYAEAIRLTRAALAIAEAHDDRAGCAHLLVNLGEAYISGQQGHRAEGLIYLEQARPMCAAVGDHLGLAHIATQAGKMNFLLGAYALAQPQLERAVALAVELRDPLAQAKAQTYLGIVLKDQGQYAAGEAALLDAARVSEAADIEAQLGYTLANLSMVYQARGEYTPALRTIERSVRLLESIQANSQLPYSLSIMGDIWYEMGEAERARACYERALPVARQVQDPCYESFALGGRGQCQPVASGLALDDFEAALRICQRSTDIYVRAAALALARLAAGHVSAGRVSKALEVAARALQLAEKTGLPDLAAESRRLLGLAHASRSAWAEAEAELRQAIRLAESHGLLPVEWRSRHGLAGVYRRQRKPREAQAEWARAAEIVLQLGQQLASDEARRAFLQLPEAQAVLQAQAEAGPTPHRYPAGLTSREAEVLQLVAAGLTNAQIGEKLSLSTATINSHLRSIYSKLNVTSRTAATRYALEHDLG